MHTASQYTSVEIQNFEPPKKTRAYVCFFRLLSWFDSLRPINNLSVKQGRIFLGCTSTKLGQPCLAQGPQHSDASEAPTCGLLVSSQALYHWANALPSYVCMKISECPPPPLGRIPVIRKPMGWWPKDRNTNLENTQIGYCAICFKGELFWVSYAWKKCIISSVLTILILNRAVFNLGLQQRGPTGPIQPKIGGHLEKEGALT